MDLSRKVAHIRINLTGGIEKEPKTRGSVRTIQLNAKAIQSLTAIQQSAHFHSHRVFIDPKSGESYKYADGLRKYAWSPALKRAGVIYRYPYQSRHTYASMMLSKGENPIWVARQMRHSDWGMIRKVYGRWIPDFISKN